ncbi:MAG TPA: DsbA family oxidoreductase [Kofleriaceae bacterium]|nr:DsbA family oxidoreductase [Kofleriaceae bacterium]
MSSLRLDIWSDIACPWCYVGKRRLEAALARFEHASDVVIHWRAFELDPGAPRVRDRRQSYAERLAAKYRTRPAEAEAMIARMTQVAAAEGLDFRFDLAQAGNTFDAHRLLHLAHVRDRQDALKERLLRAYFTEGKAIGDPDVLHALAVEAGLDSAEVRAVLDSDRHADDVRADEAEARELGITGVPFFVLDGRLGVSGAQPADVLLGALERAWRDRGPSIIADGAVCGPDGCA